MFREGELDGAKLAAEIRALKSDGERRKKMEKAAGMLGRPEAAREIADVCMEMMWKKWGEKGRHGNSTSTKAKGKAS
jgi:UDP-N-acetylglucosamine--N-acetylmuramyl-(pentapeptide) pyrophosphoryl-undecaprenol N-acetylglucosamine transferase